MSANDQKVNSSICSNSDVKTYRLTVLTASAEQGYPIQPITKIHQVVKEEPKYNTLFIYDEAHVVDLNSLIEVLQKLSGLRYTCVVRGIPVEGLDTTKTFARTKYDPNKGLNGNITSRPEGAPFVQIDFDKIKLPNTINVLTHPKEAVAYAVSLLPHYFQNVRHYVQLSSNAGMKGSHVVSAHVWYWLDHEEHDDDLHSWALEVNQTVGLIDDLTGKPKDLVDPKMFDAIQYHYTAFPLFKDDIPDPFQNNREWEVGGELEVVPFPKNDYSKKIKPAPVINVTAGSKNTPISFNFAIALEDIGDHAGGKGFKKYINSLLCSYFLQNNAAKVDLDLLKKILRKKILKADCSDPDHGSSYAKGIAGDKWLNGAIASAVKFADKIKKLPDDEEPINAPTEEYLPYYPSINPVPLAIGRAKLSKLVKNFFAEPEQDVGVKAGIGIGKSTTVKANLTSVFNLHKTVEYYGHTHSLNKELATKTNFNKNPYTDSHEPHHGYKTPAEPINIFGRNYLKPDGSRMCLLPELAAELADRGWSVANTLCMPKVVDDTKGLDLNGKPQYKVVPCHQISNCDYVAQFRKKYTVRFYPTSYLPKARGLFDTDLPDIAIIDETLFQTMLNVSKNDKPILVSFGQLKKANLNPTFTSVMLNAPTNAPLLEYLRTTLGSDCHHVVEEALHQAEEDENKIVLLNVGNYEQQLKAVKNMPHRTYVKKMLELLTVELTKPREESNAITVVDEGFRLLYRDEISRFVDPKNGKTVKVMTIDADINETIHKQFFPNCVFERIDVEWEATVIGCYSHTDSVKTYHDPETAEATRARAQKRIDALHNKGGVLVTGPQRIVGNLNRTNKETTADIQPIVKVEAPSDIMHNGSFLGIDKYNATPNVFNISRNEPKPEDIENLTRALFWDADFAIQRGRIKYGWQWRMYRTSTGYAKSVLVRIHPDKYCQMVLEQVREGLMLQAVGRIRPLQGKHKKVWLGSSVVTDTTYDHLLNTDDFYNGSTRLTEAFNTVGCGVLPIGQKWLSENVPSVFEGTDVGAHLKWVGTSKAELLNQLLIDEFLKVRLFEYSLEKNGGSGLKCLSKHGLVATKNALGILHKRGVKNIVELEIWEEEGADEAGLKDMLSKNEVSIGNTKKIKGVQ